MADTETAIAQPVAAQNEVGDTQKAADAEPASEPAADAPAGEDEAAKKEAPAAGPRVPAPRKKVPHRDLVIPDEPVKRYPEPPKADLDAKLEPLRAQVAEARAKQDAALTHSRARKAVLESHEANISAQRKAHKGLQEALSAKFAAKKTITDQIAQLRAQEQSTRRGGGSGGGGIESCLRGLKSAEAVEHRIQELEYRMNTESLPMAEEKKLIATIAYLRHKGRAALAAADAASVSRDELEASRKAQDVRINQLKSAVNEQKGVVDAAFAARNAEIAALPGAPATTGDPVAAQRKLISEAQVAMDAAHKAHYAALNAWRDNERIFRVQEENRRRKKLADLNAARNAEREERRLAREAELAEYEPAHPYAAQLATCTRLIEHLAPMLDSPTATAQALASLAAEDTSAKSGEAPTLGLSGATRPSLRVVKDSTPGVVTGKKSAAAPPPEDKYSAFGKVGTGKKRKGKGRRGSDTVAPDAAAASAGSVKLPSQSMETFAAFTAVEVEPPLVKSDVAAAITALQEKLAYYKTAPPPTQRAPKQQQPFGSEASQKRGATKSANSGPPPSANGDDQPPLVEGAPVPSVPASVDSNKPSFSDIIRGRAAAAAAPSNAAPTPAEAGALITAVDVSSSVLATDGGDVSEVTSVPVVPAEEQANGSAAADEVTPADVAPSEEAPAAEAKEEDTPAKATEVASADAAEPESVTA